ncbi:MAG TPA: helix-turn-helix domain-containing protein [Thermoanaerobaculia bacterium]|nr:helix-turn-helix domain-containing protein [Thermoanaerobaculia bacterium]
MPKPPKSSVALAALKKAAGLSDEELAKAVGRSKRMVSHYLTGSREPGPATLDRYARAMGYDPGAAEPVIQGLERACRTADPPLSPVDPTQAERRGMARTAFQAGLAVADLAEEQMVRIVRGRRARQARRRADRLWKVLKRSSPRQRALLVEKAEEYQRWYVAERLCHESEKAASHRPSIALDLARLAVRAAELSPGEAGWKARLLGYCQAFLANALRVQGELQQAEEVFAQAEALWKSGAQADPGLLAEWRLPDLKASLRRAQRQFDDALILHDKALMLGPEAAGRILLKKATTLEQMEDANRAVEALREAAPFVVKQGDSNLLFALRFNWTAILCDLGRVQEAEALLPEVRRQAVELRHDGHLVRVQWLQGRIDAGLGRIDEAIAGLEQVGNDFATLGMAYDCALASVKLASLYLASGKASEAKELATWMERVFRDLKIQREAHVALALFWEALRMETATAELAERLFQYLIRARYDPGLRFEA